jgi:hypothetical protein
MYTAERYESSYQQVSIDDWQAAIRNKGVKTYIAKKYEAGDVLEIDMYPLWDTKAEAAKAKRGKTPSAQAEQNRKNAQRQFSRKINANFTEEDVELILTLRDPLPTPDEARKYLQKFLKAIKKERATAGLPELKYAYAYETMNAAGNQVRPHFHLILSGGLDRTKMERMWEHGRANSMMLQPDEFGLTGRAIYITKTPRKGPMKNVKKWACSRNLETPQPKRSLSLPGKKVLTKKVITKIASDYDRARDLFEKAYPEYRFTDIRVKYSEYASGAYIYVRMIKRELISIKNKMREVCYDS